MERSERGNWLQVKAYCDNLSIGVSEQETISKIKIFLLIRNHAILSLQYLVLVLK